MVKKHESVRMGAFIYRVYTDDTHISRVLRHTEGSSLGGRAGNLKVAGWNPGSSSLSVEVSLSETPSP